MTAVRWRCWSWIRCSSTIATCSTARLPRLALRCRTRGCRRRCSRSWRTIRSAQQRIVEAGLQERRRIERDLHDGAQQRLLAASMTLARAEGASDGEAEILATARHQLRDALAELRALARGIHPAILSQSGVRAAAESLVEYAATRRADRDSRSALAAGSGVDGLLRHRRRACQREQARAGCSVSVTVREVGDDVAGVGA